MQGTYECVKVIGTFHRYGVQQSVDSTEHSIIVL